MKRLNKTAEEQQMSFGSSLDGLQEILETPVQETPKYRYVKLRAESCCGCGCSELEIRRKVKYDSHLKDGDYVGSDIKDSDEIL